MIGATLNASLEARGWAKNILAKMVHVSPQLVSEWISGRRRITDAIRQTLARKVDDGQLYLAMGREATGGPCVSPWLDGIDDHRVVCAMKTIEELEEAGSALKQMLPVLLMPPEKITDEARVIIKAGMLEIIECTTAGENTCARLARLYGISLAELWDKHHQELEEKGYLKKENSPKRAVM